MAGKPPAYDDETEPFPDFQQWENGGRELSTVTQQRQPAFSPQLSPPPPQLHQTTIVVQQPTMIGQQQRPLRDWQTGKCSCCEDVSVCLCVSCNPCYGSYLASKMGENCCVICCVPGALIAMRTRIRAENNIQGSICEDCLSLTFCPCCTLCQMGREWQLVGAARRY